MTTLQLYRPGEAAPSDGWMIADWQASQTSLMDWSADRVRTLVDGRVEICLGAAPAGSDKPLTGGAIQSDQTLTIGTLSWTAQAPQMVDGAVFGLFAYKADWQNQPALEFDFEFVGGDTRHVQLTVHGEDDAGRHLLNLEPTVIDLGFDAARGMHGYEVVLTGTGAVFRVDGRVVAFFSGADMPDGAWDAGPVRSMANLWAVDGTLSDWAGTWSDPGAPLAARLAGASLRSGDLSGAMPLLGTSGADQLSGTAAGDVVDGLAGDDLIEGRSGRDRLMGGAGNDVLTLDWGDDVVNGGAGQDWIRVNGAQAVIIDLGNAWGRQATGRGQDEIRNMEHVSGGSGADKIFGNAGDNVLKGQEGDDEIFGRGGADLLTGGLGRDILGGGSDASRDRFVFARVTESPAGAGRDIVLDFASGTDAIDLRAIDVDAGRGGDQGFHWGGSAAQAFGVWTGAIGSSLVLRADATGDAVADLEIQLNGSTRLVASDVLL